jgi:hypothetical protein
LRAVAVNVDTYRQLCAWGVRGYTMTIRYSLLAVGDLEGVDQHDTRRPLLAVVTSAPPW